MNNRTPQSLTTFWLFGSESISARDLRRFQSLGLISEGRITWQGRRALKTQQMPAPHTRKDLST